MVRKKSKYFSDLISILLPCKLFCLKFIQFTCSSFVLLLITASFRIFFYDKHPIILKVRSPDLYFVTFSYFSLYLKVIQFSSSSLFAYVSH